MPNLKFSQFQEQTDTSNVQFVVGYNGTDNVRISPSNLQGDFLPLTGGTMTGGLVVEQSGYGGIARLQATGSYPQNGRLLFGTTPAGDAAVELKLNPLDAQLEIRYGTIGANIIELRSGNTYFNKPLRIGADASVNELDDYEEGDFTPSFATSGSTAVTATYATQVGKYVKVGSKVSVFIQLKTNSLSVPATSFKGIISGLPFTVGSTVCCPSYVLGTGGNITDMDAIGWTNNANISTTTEVVPTAIANTTQIQFKYTQFGSGTYYNTALSALDTFQTHSSPTPARNGMTIQLTYYTTQ